MVNKNTLSARLSVPKEVFNCKNFDEVLARGYFAKLSEAQQILVYSHFFIKESDQEKVIPYTDLEGINNDFNIFVEGADTSVRDLVDEGYHIRVCGGKGNELRGLAAWFDEGDWKYLGVVYVTPKFRRRGIMQGLIEDGYDGRVITTKVHSGNKSALKAFDKYGFEIQKREGDYFHLARQ